MSDDFARCIYILNDIVLYLRPYTHRTCIYISYIFVCIYSGCGPCKQLGPILEEAAMSSGGNILV